MIYLDSWLMRCVLAVLLVVFTGCDSDPAIDMTVGTTEGPLILSVKEYASHGAPTSRPPRLALEIETEEILECVNYRLNVTVDAEGHALDLAVLGIEPLYGCFTALGPARVSIPLDGPDGTYRLSVRHDGALDEYRLRIAPDRVQVEPVRAVVTSVPELLVWRRPVRSFVYLCSTFTGAEALCDQFRVEIEALATVNEIEVPAAGVWPYPRSSGGYYNDFPGRVYQYETEADFLTVQDRLRTFAHEVLRNYGGDELRLENWRGEEARSSFYENE